MAKTKRGLVDPSVFVGYVRCSTEEQSDSGLGLAAQRTAIQAECARRGWNLLAIREDAGASGKSVSKRPGLSAALDDLESGRVAGIVVAKLDRLSRSLADFANLMARAQSAGWNLVALDLGVDLGSAAGEFMANVMASAAQWERRIIGQRTKDALAEKRSEGVTLGRPTVLPEPVVERILAARSAGDGWSTIARALNTDKVPTAHGGAQWHPSTVRAVALGRGA